MDMAAAGAMMLAMSTTFVPRVYAFPLLPDGSPDLACPARVASDAAASNPTMIADASGTGVTGSSMTLKRTEPSQLR